MRSFYLSAPEDFDFSMKKKLTQPTWRRRNIGGGIQQLYLRIKIRQSCNGQTSCRKSRELCKPNSGAAIECAAELFDFSTFPDTGLTNCCRASKFRIAESMAITIGRRRLTLVHENFAHVTCITEHFLCSRGQNLEIRRDDLSESS